MRKILDQPLFFAEQVAQAETAKSGRQKVKYFLRQLRDWCNDQLTSGTSYSEIQERIDETRRKYEFYRLQL